MATRKAAGGLATTQKVRRVTSFESLVHQRETLIDADPKSRQNRIMRRGRHQCRWLKGASKLGPNKAGLDSPGILEAHPGSKREIQERGRKRRERMPWMRVGRGGGGMNLIFLDYSSYLYPWGCLANT